MNRLMDWIEPAATLAPNVGFATARKLANSLGDANQEIALLSASGRLIHTPAGFERHLGDGLTLRGGLLRSWHYHTDSLLTAAIQRAVGEAPVGRRAGRQSTCHGAPTGFR